MRQKAQAVATSGPAQKPGAGAQPAGDDVNWLNVGLMAASCAAAILAPFHTFLLAYTILGPLHYLTEISWLHDRNYFTRRKLARQWWLALVLFTLGVVAMAYANHDSSRSTVVFGTTMICLVFASAAAAIYVRDWRLGLGLLVILALGLSFFSSFPGYAWAVLAVTLLTTIIHVFLFTGAFILHGALKSRSRVAVLSLAVFVTCAITAVRVNAPFHAPTDLVRQLYQGFDLLNRELLLLFGRTQDVYAPVGIGVMRLIAFAYLYHYLNWFSKTSIIKWHEVPRSRGVAILGFWAAGGLVYLYDYRLGLGLFYVLSMLHVFLEFPLNHQTLVGIGQLLHPAQLRRPARPIDSARAAAASG